MSQTSCCVTGCPVIRKDGVPLHRFPNPETFEEKFKTWISNVGGLIAKLDHQTIYDNKRVCHRHFEELHKYPTGRLSKLAIPTLHIPEYKPIPIDDDCPTQRGDTGPQPGCSYWQRALAEFSYDDEVTVPLETGIKLEPSPLQQDVLKLDPDLMEILDEDPTSTREFGSEIQKDLAVRLNHIATSGLSKKNRKELKDRYLVPVNCKFIKAPTLNPEIRASLIETQAKEDKDIENKQVLTSCALSSISEAITELLSSGQKNPKLLKPLIDTARILGDMQYTDSISRRMSILSTVKKEVKDRLAKTKIDEMLFGSSSEILKSAKTIIKSGADLRPSSTIESTAHKPARAVTKPLKYRAHTAGHRQLPPLPPGGARYARASPSTPNRRQPMRTTHNNASKTSSRQPQAGHRR